MNLADVMLWQGYSFRIENLRNLGVFSGDGIQTDYLPIQFCLFSVGAGGYGPPLSAGRGTPTQPPSPFNAFLVTTPAGGFAAPQGYPQQGYSTTPQFGQ